MKTFLKIILLLCPIFFVTSRIDGGCARFRVQVNIEEKQDITYIVHTLASNSTLGLWKYQKSLEEAGARTKGVTAFEFFAFILTTPSLKKDLATIVQKGGLPYKRFVNGFNKNFQKEAADPCFDKTFEGFCKVCSQDPKTLKPIFLNGYEKSQAKKDGVPFGPFIKALLK
ncbi:MAG: hypothetical protein ACOYK9_01825 [Chlamydiia bacterium]